MHCEGLLPNSLLGLLLWGAVYEAPVADAFRMQHQTTPLDLDYRTFYAARKGAIDER